MACAERRQWRKGKRNVTRRTPVPPRLAGTSGRHLTRSAHHASQMLSVDAVPRNLTRRYSRTAVIPCAIHGGQTAHVETFSVEDATFAAN